MLMVIFGAGASYDSWSSRRPVEDLRTERANNPIRPPLANELFLNNDFFRARVARYPDCRKLIPELEPRFDAEFSVEQQLERIKGQADSEAIRQLTAIEHYLRVLIIDCQNAWSELTMGVSNYPTLINQIQRSGSSCCFVTFNYDTMIEDGLAECGIQIKRMDDYPRGQFPLFKLHGSVNWERFVEYPAPQFPKDVESKINPIQWAPHARPSDVIRLIGESRELIEQMPSTWVPALAIPVATKSKFVCPTSHEATLRQLIPQVTKVLVVGWRAGEQNFIEMLAGGLTHPVKTLAVCGNEKSAGVTLARLADAGSLGDTYQDPGGFSDFVAARRIEEFL